MPQKTLAGIIDCRQLMETKQINLVVLAKQVMVSRGLQPEFPQEAFDQLNTIKHPAPITSNNEDLRSLLWCSIDNDDSQDLDQLTYAEKNKTEILSFG